MESKAMIEWMPCLVCPGGSRRVLVGAIHPSVLNPLRGLPFEPTSFAGVVAFSPNPWHVDPYKHSWEWLSMAGLPRLDIEKTPPALFDWIVRYSAMAASGREMAAAVHALGMPEDA